MKTWRTAATLAAALMLQAPAAWSQAPRPPQNDQELKKQEAIYQSQGADVPSGYVTGRALSDYADALPSGFCAALKRLGSNDRWLDIGAGAGHAILDYTSGDVSTTEKCAGSGGRASAVAVSIEDRRTDAWRQRKATAGDRIRYFSGKRFREYSLNDLGKFQLITDVYGAFSYTDDLSGFLERSLKLLEVGGGFYSLVQSVRLEDGSDDPAKTYYLTELADAAGRDVKVCSWLKQATCVQVTCESHSDWHTPTELVSIRKTCEDVSLPRTRLINFQAGSPPARKFVLEGLTANKGASLVPVRAQ